MQQQQLKQQGAVISDAYSSAAVFIPDSLKFKPVRQGLPAKRVPVKIRAEMQSYASNNNKLVRIMLPNNALYDTRSGYLTFNALITTAGGTYRRVHYGIHSLFNRFRVLVGATEVEDLRDYNRIVSAELEMTNPTLVTSTLGALPMGFGTKVQREAQAASATGTQFVCPVISGVLNTELLPFDNIPNGVVLEFYLEDGTACIETDGTLPVITLSNIEFHMERLDVDPSYRSYIKNYVSANGLQLGFHTWDRYIAALNSGARQDVLINCKISSMNGLLNFLIDSSTLNNTQVNDKFLTWLPLTLQQTQVTVNGQVFPDEPIDTVTGYRYECYQGYCRWMKKWKLNALLEIAPPITNAAYILNRFVQIDDFEPYPEEDDIINPFSTLTNNSTIIKKLFFSSTIPLNYQLDTWVNYFKQIGIFTDGSVRVLQ